MKAILDTSVLLATNVPELEGELAISAEIERVDCSIATLFRG